jgi:hypothetical protein
MSSGEIAAGANPAGLTSTKQMTGSLGFAAKATAAPREGSRMTVGRSTRGQRSTGPGSANRFPHRPPAELSPGAERQTRAPRVVDSVLGDLVSEGPATADRSSRHPGRTARLPPGRGRLCEALSPTRPQRVASPVRKLYWGESPKVSGRSLQARAERPQLDRLVLIEHDGRGATRATGVPGRLVGVPTASCPGEH